MTSMPLAHLTVLDLTAHRAGPTAVRQLADWGANVIKIEPPGSAHGDVVGGYRHGFDFQNLHRNKRAMTVNLKSPEGREIFFKLVEQADVVVENYRSDVKQRLGIDYDAVAKINPRVIYGSISGFGQTGPDAVRPGVDQIAQGMGGLMSITGRPVKHPALGDIRVVGQPINLIAVPQPPAMRATPELGQHTDEVLANLGYGAGAIADLRARGIV